MNKRDEMRRVEERVEDNKSGEDDTFKKCFQKMPSKDAFKNVTIPLDPRVRLKDIKLTLQSFIFSLISLFMFLAKLMSNVY